MSTTRPPRYRYPLVVLVASSGAGKTTLGKRLLAEKVLPRVISCTTRAPRADDPENAYVFLSDEAFSRGVEAGEFIEWDEPFAGTRYGRRWADLEPILRNGPAFADMSEKGVRAFREAGIPLVCLRIEPSNFTLPEHAKARMEEDAARRLIPIETDATIVNDHAASDGLDRAYDALLAAIRERVPITS